MGSAVSFKDGGVKTWAAVVGSEVVGLGGSKAQHCFTMVLTGTGTLTVEVEMAPGSGYVGITGSPFNATVLKEFTGLYDSIKYTSAGLGAGESIVLAHQSYNEGDCARRVGNVTTTPGVPGFA